MPPLVTGAAGFAGSHLVEHLLEREPHVLAWGTPAPSQKGAAERVLWRQVDVTDRAAVVRAITEQRPTAVYHCAGIADVHGAWADPTRPLRVNALGTHHLLSAMREAGLDGPVLVTGSALVYQQSTAPLAEDAPIRPSSPYALSKLAQEMIAAAASGRVLITRSFNHAGPRQADAYVTSSFAKQIAEAEAGLREAVLEVGNLDARRDITDVRDTVRAYRLLLERGSSHSPYNVCCGTAYRVGDLLSALVQRARTQIEVRTDPARLRPNDNPVVLGDPARVCADTGWSPRIPIERTLDDLLDYWRRTIPGAAA